MNQPSLPPQPVINPMEPAIASVQEQYPQQTTMNRFGQPIQSPAIAALHQSFRSIAPEQHPPEFASRVEKARSTEKLPTLSTVSTEAKALGTPTSSQFPLLVRPQPEPQPPRSLQVQSRDGENQEFEIPTEPFEPDADVDDALPEAEEAEPSPAIPPEPQETLEIVADEQQYDAERKIVTATGNVVVRFARGVFTADRVRVNLNNRLMVGDGNAAMRRGQQLFRGDTFEYQLIQDRGKIYQASGEIYQPTAGTDWDIKIPSDETAASLPERPLSERLVAEQPVSNVQPAGAFSGAIGTGVTGFAFPQPGVQGEIKRMRFEADYVEFDSEGWQATNIRLTNDPFSPPELEIRADTAKFTRLSPLVDELRLSRSRIVLDRGLELPLFQDRLVFDRRPRRPGLFAVGLDGELGGVFIEREYTLLETPRARWTVTPQFLAQRAILEEGLFDLRSLGAKTDFSVDFDSRTVLRASARLTSLDLSEVEDNLRASARLQRAIGSLSLPHVLTAEYSYRDRLFNGSLGFQDVQSTVGLVLTSPNYVLGPTGVNLRYQGAIQEITANTDRPELLEPGRDDDRVTLTRTQGVAGLSRGFVLWQGETLPPTPTEGLRYTSAPIRPYLSLSTSVTGVTSYYSNGDSQDSIAGTIGIQGQLGHFSKPAFDYTGFNISYSQTAFNAESPFLFDRVVDSKQLSYGITQQIYGPFRVGFQQSLNLDTGDAISTDYTLEYSRRTYSVQIRYNPVQGLGALLIRIGDFNWSGYSAPFDAGGITPVVQGVSR